MTSKRLPEVTKAMCNTRSTRNQWAVMRACERSARVAKDCGNTEFAAMQEDNADRAARELNILLKGRKH
jgi:hypothetical protein